MTIDYDQLALEVAYTFPPIRLYTQEEYAIEFARRYRKSLKEKMEPFAWGVEICEEPTYVNLNKDEAEAHFNRMQRDYPDDTRKLHTLFTYTHDAQAEIERLMKELKEAEDDKLANYRKATELRQQLDAERQLRVRQVEELNQLVDHLRQQLAEREGWQPIETAPKDESNVLLFDGEVQIGSWYNNVHPWNNGDWWIAGGQCTTQTATHWMPLPAAPKPGDGE